MNHFCCYCGVTEDIQFHHVIPISFSNKKRARRELHLRQNTVGCCPECNKLLTNHFPITIAEGAEFLEQRLVSKYRKILNTPLWGEEELEKMGERMLRKILHQMSLRLALIDRLRHLGVMSRLNVGIRDYWDAVDEGKTSMILPADPNDQKKEA